MGKEQDYINFSAEDFINDEYFQDWALNRNGADTRLFWKQFIERYPHKQTEIDKALQTLKGIPFEKEWNSIEPTDEMARQSFERVSNILGLGRKKKGRIVSMKYRWWAAAAVLLGLISGGYFLSEQWKLRQNENLAANNPSVQSKDIAPGGNKAILTLADGSKIVLDSANNGAITKQGNITVIKLNDGEIAYNFNHSNSNPQASGTSAVGSSPDSKPSTLNYNTISTPRGGQYQLVLADGSKVWLNAESSLRFPTAFAGNERKVQLMGEGYFEVAHNASKPFRVSVNDMTVEVLGTHFNVNAYKDEDAVKTTLLQGSVRVSEGKERVKIKPGQQARLETGNNKLQTINDVNVDAVVAWKNGYFQFNGANIQTVMNQVSRWYDVDVVYEGKPITKVFEGMISMSLSASNVFKILEATGGAHFKIEGRKVVVTP